MKELGFIKILIEDLKRLKDPSKKNSSNFFFVFLTLFNPRFIPVLIIRISSFIYNVRLLRILSYILSWFNLVIFGIECTPKCKIGFGLIIPHSSGIVIGASKIGKNVTIFQGVTLGAQVADMEYDVNTRPIIGNNVVIGSGAKILGNIRVGNNVVIGANSVVLEDIDDDAVVGGIPAKIITKKQDRD